LPDSELQWKRMGFKAHKVWLAVDAAGKPFQKDKKVLIKYQLDQAHEYWVRPSSVYPLTENGLPVQPSPRPQTKPVAVDRAVDCSQAICIYTDGACSGNPGPAGIGIVMRHNGHEKEISRYIGTATNNIAELEAIRTALAMVRNLKIPVLIHTDSSYALGILSKGWKAKQNLELVAEIRRLMDQFDDLRLIKVKGHAGHPDNERADQLAVAAINGKA
jgi:ribonuclease HI